MKHELSEQQNKSKITKIKISQTMTISKTSQTINHRTKQRYKKSDSQKKTRKEKR